MCVCVDTGKVISRFGGFLRGERKLKPGASVFGLK